MNCEHRSFIKFAREVYNTSELIPLHQPVFGNSEKEILNEIVESSFVSSVGEYVNRFERDFCASVDCRNAVAVVNGTSALHLALLQVGVTRGDLVLTQALTFVATANAIRYCGADPVFIDIDRATLGLSPSKLEDWLHYNCKLQDDGSLVHLASGRPIKCCLPMHTLGHIVEMDLLQDVCLRWKIPIIEDAAESLGSTYKGRHAGTLGDLGVSSFNGNKIITTGGGGMVFSKNVSLDWLSHISKTAKNPHQFEYIHDEVGYNYRMPNVNAGLGVAQMRNLPLFVEGKRALANAYKKFFHHFEGIEFHDEPPGSKSNFWLNAVKLPNKDLRDKFIADCLSSDVMVRPLWRPLHLLEMYRDCLKGDLSNTIDAYNIVVNIPSSYVTLEHM